MCSCCPTSPYREVCRAKGGIKTGETLWHDIYPARAITTVSLASNTYCMMDGQSAIALAHLAPWAPGSNLAVHVNRAIDDRPAHTAGGHLLSVVQAANNTESISKPSTSQWSQIKEDIVEPSVPAREAWYSQLPVRTARTFVHHYNSTQYCKKETVFSILPFLQTSTRASWLT